MDQKYQFSYESSPVYMSAPSSPSKYCQDTTPFYSAPSSPTGSNGTPKTNDDDFDSNFVDFEFETSKKFGLGEGFEFETGKLFFEYPAVDEDRHEKQAKEQRRQRGDSMPTMAFADELFANGKVLAPLKLPPRLVCVNGAQSPTGSSPRSPSLALKIAFPWRNAWNDDFDPFAVALENVKGERSLRMGRARQHRRSRSHSPFRTPTSAATGQQWSCNASVDGSDPHQISPGRSEVMRQSKGSAYARGVITHNKQSANVKPKMATKFKWYPFRWRAMPVSICHEQPKGNRTNWRRFWWHCGN